MKRLAYALLTHRWLPDLDPGRGRDRLVRWLERHPPKSDWCVVHKRRRFAGHAHCSASEASTDTCRFAQVRVGP